MQSFKADLQYYFDDDVGVDVSTSLKSLVELDLSDFASQRGLRKLHHAEAVVIG